MAGNLNNINLDPAPGNMVAQIAGTKLGPSIVHVYVLVVTAFRYRVS